MQEIRQKSGGMTERKGNGMQWEINRREVRRYLGYGNKEPDEAVNDMVEDCICQLKEAVVPKAVYQVFPLKHGDADWLDLTAFCVQSKNLVRNLRGCGEVILFAATLGIQADQLIARLSKRKMSQAVVMQAVAAAAIEAYCDSWQAQLKELFQKKGNYLRPRFSPGYGDFPLEFQVPFLQALECPKKIGLTVTDSLLLAPSKSVTAVMGISCQDEKCPIQGCEACEKADCQFRR